MTTAQRTYPNSHSRGGAAARGIIVPILTLILIALPIYIALLFMDVVPLPMARTQSEGHKVYERAEPGNLDSEWVLVKTVTHDELMADEEARKFMHDYMELNFDIRCEDGQRYVLERGWFGQVKADTWTCK